jgi:Na+/H+ antiporter NhaD/arsenite permease-like protein
LTARLRRCDPVRVSGGSIVRLIVLAIAAFAAASSAAAADAAGPAALDWSKLELFWAIPFVGILLSIAILPLAAPHFWHHRQGAVSFGWALAFLVPFMALYGFEATHYEFLHAMLLDYLPFVIMLFALYTISGGVYVKGHFEGTPLNNTGLLALGTGLASFTGTTGASVLLIRPLIRANAGRKHNVHTVIFFIFLVSNIGGSLTPLGDPPLYLGFLKGVDFFWTTTNLLAKTIVAVAVLLTVFFVLDSLLYGREAKIAAPKGAAISMVGKRNLLLLAAVVGVVLWTATWETDAAVTIGGIKVDYPSIVRSGGLLAIAFLSLAITPSEARKGNEFNWGPMAEVAKLFFGIFVCIVPVLGILKAGMDGAAAPVIALVSNPDGTPNNAAYFWVTGGLSSFLDNAPTYLVFFNVAGGDPQTLMTSMAGTLAAISAGAVFMGANTYIGNAPNFMVKAIAEDMGVKMPSFFGYMGWSIVFLLPTFALITYLFFV